VKLNLDDLEKESVCGVSAGDIKTFHLDADVGKIEKDFGKLFIDGEKSRYVTNSLWIDLSNQV